MDVDCDGADNGAGACSNDPSGQGQTAFKDEVSQYGISDLNANIHPYVVFGNDGSSPSFDPKKYGMQPLGVMAVVCNGQLVSTFPQDSRSRSWFLTLLHFSTMVYGEILMAASQLAKPPFLLPSSASPTTTSLAITDTERRMSCTSGSQAKILFLVARLTGMPRTAKPSRKASSLWEIDW